MKKPTFVNNSPTNLSLQRFKRKKGAVIGLVVLILLILSALFSDILTPYEFDKINPINALRPPSLEHPMGTDAFGRDQLTRIMHGGKVSLQVGMISVLIGGTFGILMGAIAGFFGGWIDEIVSRFIDIMLAFPSILLALAVVSVLGPDLYNLMIAVGISSIPAFARLVRSAVLSIKENDKFWAKEGKRISWIKKYTKIKDVKYSKDEVKIKWYYDGTLNASVNCIDRHSQPYQFLGLYLWALPDQLEIRVFVDEPLRKPQLLMG